MSFAKTSQKGILHKFGDAELNRRKIVCIGSDTDHVKYAAAATDIPVGTTPEGTPAGLGAEQHAPVQMFGRGETEVVKMSGAGTVGQHICPAVDGSGDARVVPATAGAYYACGVIIQTAEDDEEAMIATYPARLVGAQHANGQFGVPAFATDPGTPAPGQMWVNSADNALNIWINGAKRTITFIALALAFCLFGLILSQPAAAADKTPMVQVSAVTGGTAAAVQADNVKVPGTLEVTGASTFTGNVTMSGSLTGSSFIGKVSKTFSVADMTDNTNTTGYIDFTSQLPAGCVVLGWKCVTAAGFSGDTTATIQVGKSGAVGAYSTVTSGSCLTAVTVGSASVLATSFEAAAVAPRVTITGGADFTSISAGTATVTVFYAY